MVHDGAMSDLTRIPTLDGVFPAAQYSHVVLGGGRFVAIAGQLALGLAHSVKEMEVEAPRLPKGLGRPPAVVGQ